VATSTTQIILVDQMTSEKLNFHGFSDQAVFQNIRSSAMCYRAVGIPRIMVLRCNLTTNCGLAFVGFRHLAGIVNAIDVDDTDRST